MSHVSQIEVRAHALEMAIQSREDWDSQEVLSVAKLFEDYINLGCRNKSEVQPEKAEAYAKNSSADKTFENKPELIQLLEKLFPGSEFIWM